MHAHISDGPVTKIAKQWYYWSLSSMMIILFPMVCHDKQNQMPCESQETTARHLRTVEGWEPSVTYTCSLTSVQVASLVGACKCVFFHCENRKEWNSAIAIQISGDSFCFV